MPESRRKRCGHIHVRKAHKDSLELFIGGITDQIPPAFAVQVWPALPRCPQGEIAGQSFALSIAGIAKFHFYITPGLTILANIRQGDIMQTSYPGNGHPSDHSPLQVSACDHLCCFGFTVVSLLCVATVVAYFNWF